MNEYKTRIADENDVGRIMDLLILHGPEFPVSSVNYAKALDHVRKFVKEGTVIIVEHQGAIVASAALMPEQLWYSDDWVLMDYWAFVHPKFRKSRAASLLLKGVRELARMTDLTTFIAVRSLKQVDQKNKFFRRFFVPVGELFACQIHEASG